MTEARTAIVTGANSGLGHHTATALAGAGLQVILAGRSRPALEQAADRIRAQHPDATLAVEPVDLTDGASIAAFADAITQDNTQVDLLVNNAGIMNVKRRTVTPDGSEITFATNHLGHFALTGRLLPALLRSPAPRVVTVSAVIARRGRLDFDNLDLTSGYRPMRAYANSKLANIAFSNELASRAAAAGHDLLSVALHPGSAATNLQRRSSRPVQWLARRLLPHLGQQPAQAAETIIYAALDEDIDNGGYYSPGGYGRGEMRGAPSPALMPDLAQDHDLRTTLWQVSEHRTGVRYDGI